MKKLEVLERTKSFCPICFRNLDSKIFEKNDLLYIEKKCPEHGMFKERYIWDKEVYTTLKKLIPTTKKYPNGILLQITSKCNMKCPFCFEDTVMKHGYHLNLKDIKKILKNFRGKIVHLSGGEPTLHKDFFKIVRFLKNNGYKVIVLSNGKMFSEKSFTKKAKTSGVDAVVLGFDSLDDNTLKFFRGEKSLEFKLNAIYNLQEYDIDICLFVVSMKGKNLKETSELIRFSLNHNAVKRVEFEIPWKHGKIINFKETTPNDIIQEIENNFNIKKRDFLEFTTFLHLMYDVIDKFKTKNISVESVCYLKIWFLCVDDTIIPLNRMFNIRKMNIFLEDFRNSSSIIEFLRSFKSFPFFSLIDSFKNDIYFRKLIKGIFRVIFFGSELEKILPIKSIVIEETPIDRNIDLDFTKTCNLYSVFTYDHSIGPSCIRQMMVEKYYEKGVRKLRHLNG